MDGGLMNRKEFIIKSLVGLAILPSFLEGCKDSSSSDETEACILMPEETSGPYPIDLSSRPEFFRRDITEGRPGAPMNLTLKLFNTNNGCAPIANARVDVWHCDKDGIYSGFNLGSDGGNQEGLTFFRGIQLSDAHGKAVFKTIYPGWYQDRITHVHFQVFLNNGLIATSQFAFPESITKIVYATPIYTKGQNTSVADNMSDMEFGDSAADLQYEVCSITPNSSTGGYDATLAVGIAV